MQRRYWPAAPPIGPGMVTTDMGITTIRGITDTGSTTVHTTHTPHTGGTTVQPMDTVDTGSITLHLPDAPYTGEAAEALGVLLPLLPGL